MTVDANQPSSADIEILSAALHTALTAELPAAELLRRELHAAPCLSGHEQPAAETIERALGIAMETVADTGRVGRIGPASGPAIALRAELDALPLAEQTGVPWASHNGAMHACGHDVHQAALVAVVRAARRVKLPHALVPFLQPREESYPSGARDIMQSGIFRRHDVRVVIGAHVHPRLGPNTVSTGRGPINAAADELLITVTGVGGHGAYPHEALNPIGALAHIVTGLNEIVRRNVSPMNPSVLSIGHFRAGEAANVIPSTAQLAGTLRTMDADDRARLHRVIPEFVRAQALSFGVQAETRFVHGEPVLENDSDLVGHVDSRLTGSGLRVVEAMRSCGADDFSYYSGEYASLMAFVGVETAGADPRVSLHNERFLPVGDAVKNVALTLIAGYLGAVDLLVTNSAAEK